MSYKIAIFLFLTIISCGQELLVDQLDEKILQIENQIVSNKSNLIIIVKVFGQADLQIVVNEKWPENIETTYNILKDKNGQIVYIGEFPTSESGDWALGIKHYFSETGNLIAFEKQVSYFNENCGDGIVKEKQIELYNDQFKVIKATKKLTDKSGKILSEIECGNGYVWVIDKRPTVKELVDLKGIKE